MKWTTLLILLLAAVAGVIFVCIDSWHHATHSFGIEQVIEMDREYFQSMQPIWDKYEDEHPGWIRPESTTEEQYQQWREHYNRTDNDQQWRLYCEKHIKNK